MKKKKQTASKLIKLDIACGQNKQAGYVGIDIAKTKDADIIWDLEKFPWTPIKSESVEEAFCSHYIEHTKDLFKFFDEVHRILVKGGKLTLIAPYYSSVRAWQDPTHTRAISEHTFLYANKAWREQNKLDHYPISCDFDFTYGYGLNPLWQNKAEEARNFAIQHYINVVADIHVTLVKR